MRIVSLIILLLIVTILPGRINASTDNSILRIGLVRYNSPTLQLVSKSGCTITRTDNNALLLSGKGTFTFELNASEIAIKSDSRNPIMTASTILVTCDPKEMLGLVSSKATSKQFRGAIEISAGSGNLKVVNIVNVEDYLKGVLPSEIGESSPEEALRAQAITARTYAIANQGKHRAQGFDLCDSTHCQIYAGACSEKPKCSQAVLNTKGILITYSGKTAEVMYSTDCGGATVDYKDIRPRASFPYLCSVADPDDVSHIEWEQVYTLKELEGKLISAGVKEAAGLESISVTKVGLAKRPLEITISGAGSIIVTPAKIRAALAMKSTMFTIETGSEGKIIFKGKGAGHGVGLCQTGAKALAGPEHNYTYSQILAHYFPGTQISNSGNNKMAENTKEVSVKPQVVKVAVLPVKQKNDTPKSPEAASDTFDVRLQTPDRL